MGLFGVEMRREEPGEGDNSHSADGHESGAAPSQPSWPGNLTKNDSPNPSAQPAAETGFFAMTQNLTMMHFDTAKVRHILCLCFALCMLPQFCACLWVTAVHAA